MQIDIRKERQVFRKERKGIYSNKFKCLRCTGLGGKITLVEHRLITPHRLCIAASAEHGRSVMFVVLEFKFTDRVP